MKNWNLDEFIAECEALQRNPYLYDYDRMPEGVCNGHTVRPCQSSLTAIIIDGCIVNMGVINDRYPKGHIEFIVDGNVSMTGTEYVRYCLTSAE